LKKELISIKKDESIHKKLVFSVGKENVELKVTVEGLVKTVSELEKDLEGLRVKIKTGLKKDIYGESKRGFLGSNTKDM
jgi:hypothetical protein